MHPETPHARRYPARESLHVEKNSPFIFITACTKDRRPLLANEKVHQTLRDAWLNCKDWRVGPYVLMPDHVHILVRPISFHPLPVRRWVAWWKRLTSEALTLNRNELWQRDIWDHRLRSKDSFAEKAEYIRNNPVRRGLVEQTDLWPFGGYIYNIR